MDILSIKGRLPYEIIESMLARGLKSFTPPQEQAIEKGILESRNMVVASATSSGKTLIAEMACAKAILAQRRKAIYIAPMRALASEKFNEFRASYPYIKTAISIGDLDASDPWLSGYDMMFFSTEKLDSLLRHGIDWLAQVGCIVFDEIHMLADASRGPTLELLMTKLANTCDAQIIALSATVGNADEIAKWLKAELVESDYRPVKLRKGIVHNTDAVYLSGSGDSLEEPVSLHGTSKLPETRVVEDTLAQEKQALLFYASRRNAEAGAARASEIVARTLDERSRQSLQILSDKVLNVLERPTDQCIKLSRLIKDGAAFHHAGLLNAQRTYIEDAFKSNVIKVICATTTLAYGVNMPAHTVLVRDISRYDGGGSGMLGVNEVTQLFGRAGRPQYDKEGRAFVIASTKERIEELYKGYLIGELEPLESSLGILPVLRTHILAFVAERFLNTKRAMLDFLLKSLYGFQYKNKQHISNLIDEILEELSGWEFVKRTGSSYSATTIGQRVSELYIDPLSARWIIASLDRKLDTLGVLYMIANTLEMRPYVKSTQDAEEMFVMYRHMNKDSSILDAYDSTEYGYYDPLRAFSTAVMLNDWISEVRENEIVRKYSTTPGALYTKLSNADWLAYAAIELSRLLHRSAHDLIEARVRLRYGIKEELLDLVRLEQIGRVRARILYINGIHGIADIRQNRAKVAALLGKEISEKVLAQLE
jgi:helicase